MLEIEALAKKMFFQLKKKYVIFKISRFWS